MLVTQAHPSVSLLKQVSMHVRRGKEENTFILAMQPVSPVQQVVGMCYSHSDLQASQC